ncbi:rhomboid family intramembrane serine protease [Lewinella sp. 4G2]|uniref:rhomboid family intramembrane serine protease n=1 Tax=Lewinella sp. 4G2 TaxID=1803372 RepID=UPI0007DEEB42|nr:rhomboid family intramembrane serine protease [Lewinella sp. 4G2]OAV45884.1 rhomboid family intramembrane serine protease [Lewinella sp. 4G2]
MLITYLIIGVTVAVSLYAMNNPQLVNQLLFVPAAIKERGETYRFVSGGFIHADFMHLAFNMYTLYIFGGEAESSFQVMFGPTFGGVAYLLFYVALIILAGIPDYMKHQDNYGYRALGASGAVSGMIWPLTFFIPWTPIFWGIIPPIVWGVGYMLYSSYADKRGGDNIGHSAHLWGSVFGFLLFAVLTFFLYNDLFTSFLYKLTTFDTSFTLYVS